MCSSNFKNNDIFTIFKIMQGGVIMEYGISVYINDDNSKNDNREYLKLSKENGIKKIIHIIKLSRK